MKFTVTQPIEIDVKYVRIEAAVRHDEEDIPNDFPFRIGNVWDITVAIETGKILNWPGGVEAKLYLRVCDEGTYTLQDANQCELSRLVNEYVPHGVVPGEYGDYIDMEITSDGTITNWPQRPSVEDFFPEED